MSEGRLARTKALVGARWSALNDHRPSLRHVVSAWQLLQRNNGAQYAAAITYFSFLALFPLLLLAVSVAGFVLHANPVAERSLFAHLAANVPGGLGRTLDSSLRAAIRSRTGLGVAGFLGVLVTGLGWVGNLRAAIAGVWGRAPVKMSFTRSKISDLVVLVGLGLGSVLSLGLTVIGTSLTDQILRGLDLDGLPGAHVFLKVLGIAIAVLGDVMIFWWLIIRLPRTDVPGRIALKAALLAAIGFEVLKIVGSYTIAHTANSPTAGPFAGILAVLIWIQLVARFVLFTCAWAATLVAEQQAPPERRPPDDEPAATPVPADGVGPAQEVNPAVVGAALIGTGALAGAAATWAVMRPHPPRS